MNLALTYLVQSLRHITLHLGSALRIAALPFLVTLVAEFLYTYSSLTNEYGASVAASNLVLISNFGLVGVIAVGWHRLILLDERPGNFGVTWRGKVFFSYIVRWFFVGLIIALGVILTGLLAWMISLNFIPETLMSLDGTFGMSLDGTFGVYSAENLFVTPFAVAGFFGIWAFLWLLFRFGMILPQTAIEAARIDVGTAWAMTKPMAWPIFLLAGIAAFFQTLAIVVPIILYENYVVSAEWPPLRVWPDYAFTVFELVLYTITILIGASILTTLYGDTKPPEDPINKIKRRSNLPDF